jgi:SAM-dependent methyltransferase
MTLATYLSSLQAVNALLEKRLPRKGTRVYEAGGGSTSFIRLNFLDDARITVVDIDEVQLKNNGYAEHKILGDIQIHAFPLNSFELIVCYNVIEHLTAPDQAIRLFYQALSPGGLLVIGAPNPKSFSGWVTRLTPHWFHVWYYRSILGDRLAGQPGNLPFPTVFHPIVSPAKLIHFSNKLGFKVIHFQEYEGDQYERIKQQAPLLGTLVNATVSLANAVTFWRKDLKKGEFHLVLEKPPGGKAHELELRSPPLDRVCAGRPSTQQRTTWANGS